MRHRWLVFLAASAGTALLAAGVAVAADRAASASGRAPELRTVDRGALAGAGITLAPAPQPFYCGAARAAADRGWLPSGGGGCAVSLERARRAVMPEGSDVAESLLARVGSSRLPTLGRNQLVWALVVRQHRPSLPVIACVPATSGRPPNPCPAVPPLPSPVAVLFVDATSARFLVAVPVGTTGAAAPGVPRPVPTPTAAAKPVPDR